MKGVIFMKRIVSFLVVCTLVFSILSFGAFADSGITIKVNDQLVKTDAEPFIQDGRTLVPIRFVAEKLGAKVNWNGDLEEVTMQSKGKMIKLVIGQSEAVLGDEKIKLDTKPLLKQDRTFVPIRFIAESFDCKVDWIEFTRTVNISTVKGEVKPISEVIENPKELGIDGITKAEILPANPYDLSLYTGTGGTIFIKTKGITECLALIKDGKVVETPTSYPNPDGYQYHAIKKSELKDIDYIGFYFYRKDAIKLIENPFK